MPFITETIEESNNYSGNSSNFDLTYSDPSSALFFFLVLFVGYIFRGVIFATIVFAIKIMFIGLFGLLSYKLFVM